MKKRDEIAMTLLLALALGGLAALPFYFAASENIYNFFTGAARLLGVN